MNVSRTLRSATPLKGKSLSPDREGLCRVGGGWWLGGALFGSFAKGAQLKQFFDDVSGDGIVGKRDKHPVFAFLFDTNDSGWSQLGPHAATVIGTAIARCSIVTATGEE
jgi:hypothetical protein